MRVPVFLLVRIGVIAILFLVIFQASIYLPGLETPQINNSNKNDKTSSAQYTTNTINTTTTTTTTTNSNKNKIIEIFRDRVPIFPCTDTKPRSYLAQRGQYWVLHNYKIADSETPVNCDESVTYTTQCDFNYLHNLMPLVERWEGPISLTLYTPGTDFEDTISRIDYLRECSPSAALIKQFVSFHLFFHQNHLPNATNLASKQSLHEYSQQLLLKASDDYRKLNCSAAEEIFDQEKVTWRKKKKLLYPINVARNIAREMAPTHYVLSSDIELFPSVSLIPKFLSMIKKQMVKDSKSNLVGKKYRTKLFSSNNPKVFVLPIFEVAGNLTLEEIPEDKAGLLDLLEQDLAVPFHTYWCKSCHRLPQMARWRKLGMKSELNVFHKRKRRGPFWHWEPIFIGTKEEPMFDERLSWEGRKDKMTQNYIMCILDYEYHILDNAFLVHSPGIKGLDLDGKIQNATITKTSSTAKKQNSFITKFIEPEIKILYGTRRGCKL